MIKRSVVLCDMAEETRVQVSRSLVKCGFRIDWPMETFENLLLRCQGMPDAHLPDLVMLDITTPDGKRVDTLKKLLTRDPEAYVVVLMGPGQRAEAEKLVRRGAKDCLETPVQEIPLISLLARRNVPCHGAAEAVREVIRQEEKRRQESLDAMGEELRAAMEEVRAKSNPAERPPHIRIQAGAYGDESPADVDEEGFDLQDTADEEIGILLEKKDIMTKMVIGMIV